MGRLPPYFAAVLSTLLHLIWSVSCAALSLCFCFLRLLADILLLWVPVRRYVIWTIIFDRIGLFGLILRIAVVRKWFALLQRWVCMIVISAEAGFGAALTLPL